MSAPRGRKAVFLDRDGVLNAAVVRGGKPYPPSNLDEVRILPGVEEACRRLRRAGWLLVVVTNQPDVARGLARREAVEAINRHLVQRLGLDDVRTCYHDDADGCGCRKPAPGLLLEAARDHGIDLAASWMVGDRWRDVEAGRRAGCRTAFVDSGYDERRPETPDLVVHSLAEAASGILEEPLMKATDLKVKVFADGADKAGMLEMYADPLVKGFTTNPTLMRKAGISDYRGFAREILACIPDRPISFEVFSDDLPEMKRQAMEIRSWGPNVFVKIPVTNTRGESTAGLVGELARAGVQLNVTAVFTLEQVRAVSEALGNHVASNISVFAGRIADSGRDPLPIMAEAVRIMSAHPRQELIWASPRELLNVVQADQVGCHIITATNDIIRKLPLLGKDLAEYSLDTVRMFRKDAVSAGYTL